MKSSSLNNSPQTSVTNSDRKLIVLVVVLLALVGVIGAAAVWVYFDTRPPASPTPAQAPALTIATAASPPTSAIPTLPPEWTASPFPTRAAPSGSQPAPTITSTTGTFPTTTTAGSPVPTTTRPASTAGGPASTVTPTPTLAAPETPVIPPGGYPGAGTPTPLPPYP